MKLEEDISDVKLIKQVLINRSYTWIEKLFQKTKEFKEINSDLEAAYYEVISQNKRKNRVIFVQAKMINDLKQQMIAINKD